MERINSVAWSEKTKRKKERERNERGVDKKSRRYPICIPHHCYSSSSLWSSLSDTHHFLFLAFRWLLSPFYCVPSPFLSFVILVSFALQQEVEEEQLESPLFFLLCCIIIISCSEGTAPTMNATLCSSLFLISFFLFVLVGAVPSLPSTYVTHQSVLSPSSLSSPPSPRNTLNNNNNNNNEQHHYHARSINDPNPTTGNQRLLVLTVQYPDRVLFSFFYS